MAQKGKVVLGVLLFLAVVGIAIVFFSYQLLTRSLPQTTGRISLEILKRPVKVYRDAYGVPHILAENSSDLYKAVGYVQAQDRLWQMDFNRHVSSGRLSELFGESAIDSDKFIRTWGFRRIATQIYENLSEESRSALDDYAAGVNAYITSHRDKLPVEFAILGYEPEPWRPGDTIAFSRFMAWRMSFSWYVDLVLEQLIARLGDSKARQVFPGFPDEGPLIVPRRPRPFWTQTQRFLESGMELRAFLGLHSAQLGSNSWVVSGEKSACGKPLLANDPHLEIVTPSVWYELHASDGKTNVAGVSLAGTPGILIGHNEDIAWGITNGMLDDADFYRERIDPENPERYLDNWQWKEFEVVKERIKVRNSDPVDFELRFTVRGPVISDIHPLLKDSSEVVTMRWTGLELSDEFLAILKLQQGKNWQDFLAALRHFKVPAQNFVFASAVGDIGYHLGGAIPIRKYANGMLSHNGWELRGQWQDWVAFDKLPHVYNPPEHFIVTANNKMVDDRYPFYLTHLWEPHSRAARITELLAPNDSLTLDDFKRIQTDVTSIVAQELLPQILEVTKAALDTTADEQLRMVYDLVKIWDGVEAEESVAASLFNAFLIKVIENTFADEMGETLFSNYIRLSNVPARVIATMLRQTQSEWFDNVNTESHVESREEIITQSMRDAAEMLKKMAGDSISDWKWGELHTLTMQHPLGRRKPFDKVLNIGPFSRPGSKMTVNNSEYRFRSPFTAFLGASTRQLVDFCDINQSLAVLPSGQSGQRMSDHYSDQTELWLNGQYHSMPLDWVEVMQSASEFLQLLPAK